VTRSLSEAAKGSDHTLALYCFDGFLNVLLNNLNALYESERAYLDLVFDQDEKYSSSYLQKGFYSQTLRNLVWRASLLKPAEKTVENLTKLFAPWQKVLPIDAR